MVLTNKHGTTIFVFGDVDVSKLHEVSASANGRLGNSDYCVLGERGNLKLAKARCISLRSVKEEDLNELT